MYVCTGMLACSDTGNHRCFVLLGVMCYNPGGTQSLYLQKAADRILDRSTRQHDTGNSHVTGETDQGVLAAACICVSRVSRAHPACCSVHEQVSKVSRAHPAHRLSTI